MATKDYERAAEQMMKGNGAKCPTATQDITVNLKNRGKAIDSAAYGPENPALPNTAFWKTKADEWQVSIKDAKTSRCGNCSAFNQEKSMLDCIAKGIGDEGDPWAMIEAGDLGYCEIFDFKCAASRTCDAWVAGSDQADGEDNGEDGEYSGNDAGSAGMGSLITINVEAKD
ncbi:hypothetical protein UFOVP1016_53 [uncultured Caudovirales phage]|uniref:Uncharacterized protein n=1 Tax=uncultured Caudovirales phage TaxID=2100421 RepID=A0A6J5QF13_9CAUD|nr:hypothetical protein UFOVP1016_53 [uncultured Caudovirales phage]